MCMSSGSTQVQANNGPGSESQYGPPGQITPEGKQIIGYRTEWRQGGPNGMPVTPGMAQGIPVTVPVYGDYVAPPPPAAPAPVAAPVQEPPAPIATFDGKGNKLHTDSVARLKPMSRGYKYGNPDYESATAGDLLGSVGQPA